MIDLYYWPTPNGHKVSIMLEEVGLDYTVHAVNILEGEQFEADFLTINPNHRIPAIVDRDGPSGEPYALFESGAILMYLAEKTGCLWPSAMAERYKVIQWLTFQIANVGPMFGQCGHFKGYAPEPYPYSIERYFNETLRLYGVMDGELQDKDFLAGDYSIADIAVFPWVMPKVRELHEVDIGQFPSVAGWFERIFERPAVQRGTALLEEQMKLGDPSEEAREALFGKRQNPNK